jgi:pilus assembly protein CpaE
MTASILIVDDSEMMLKLVSAALKADGYELFTAQNGKEALEIARRVVPNLAILDMVLPDIDGYQICKTLRNDPHTAHMPIIMLTGFSDLDNRLRAFEAGADDFMPKPFQMEELQARVRVHLRRASSYLPHHEANVRIHRIAVFSLRGGIGVSTLAVNLAAGLSQLWATPTLLMDLAFLNGQDALMFDITLRNTWADLGNLKPDEIDVEALESVALHHASGVEVLAAPRRAEEAELISEKHVQRIIELARSQYKYLVMDLPHDFSPTTLAALDKSDTILLLTAPDLASVRCASNALNVFKDLGYSAEKVQLVLNWNFSTSGLARKEIEKVLQKPVSVVIPHLPNTLVMAITLGKPIVLEIEKPEAALFEDLAYFWSKEDEKKNDPANPSAAWQRVMERTKRRQQQKNKA